jgi:hypothetical protein
MEPHNDKHDAEQGQLYCARARLGAAGSERKLEEDGEGETTWRRDTAKGMI